MIRWLAVFLAFLPTLTAQPALAAQQLTGSYVVMTMPDGFAESQQFTGALWPEGSASILVAELPAKAYEPVAKGLLADPTALAEQGILLDRTEETTQGEHKAVIGRGRQQVGTQAYDKWLLLIGAPHVALLVTAQMPSLLATAERKAKVEAALESITIAPERSNPRASLPFTFGETERFRFSQTLSGSAVLLTDTAYKGNAGTRPLFVAGMSLGTECDPWRDDPHAFAAQTLQSLNQVENLAISGTTATAIGGDDALVTEATGSLDGEPVIAVQTIRFRECAYLRTVGIGPVADAALYRKEFSALSARVGWKSDAVTKPQPTTDK